MSAEDDRKLFIGGLPLEMSEEQVYKGLSNALGPDIKIRDFELKMRPPPSNLSRGFCFATFSTREDAEKALQIFASTKVFEGKLNPMWPDRNYYTRDSKDPAATQTHYYSDNRRNDSGTDESSPSDNSSTEKYEKRIFIQGITDDVSIDDLRKAIQDFCPDQKIEDFFVPLSHHDGGVRGFGFAMYATKEAAQKVLSTYKEAEAKIIEESSEKEEFSAIKRTRKTPICANGAYVSLDIARPHLNSKRGDSGHHGRGGERREYSSHYSSSSSSSSSHRHEHSHSHDHRHEYDRRNDRRRDEYKDDYRDSYRDDRGRDYIRNDYRDYNRNDYRNDRYNDNEYREYPRQYQYQYQHQPQMQQPPPPPILLGQNNNYLSPRPQIQQQFQPSFNKFNDYQNNPFMNINNQQYYPQYNPPFSQIPPPYFNPIQNRSSLPPRPQSMNVPSYVPPTSLPPQEHLPPRPQPQQQQQQHYDEYNKHIKYDNDNEEDESGSNVYLKFIKQSDEKFSKKDDKDTNKPIVTDDKSGLDESRYGPSGRAPPHTTRFKPY